MRILITGGAGFIGTYLVKSLLQQNHIVTIFDNFSNSKKDSILQFSELGVKIIEGDIINKEEISNAVKDQQIVIHLAAKISVDESIKKPQETIRVNVDGTINVLEECKKNKIENIIIASSAAVYDDAGSHTKILDEDAKKNPISPYGKSKMIMEEKVREFVKINKMNCVILRFFNIYGIGQSNEYAGVITKFASNIRNNKSLVIYGDGLQTRDFVSIDDVVSVINFTISVSGKFGVIYNIGCGNSITIKDLANLMLKISRKKLNIEFVEQKKGDIRFSQTSIERSKKDLGYLPKISLEKGIRYILEKL
jgi:UDP-glucose 4-epimerase